MEDLRLKIFVHLAMDFLKQVGFEKVSLFVILTLAFNAYGFILKKTNYKNCFFKLSLFSCIILPIA